MFSMCLSLQNSVKIAKSYGFFSILEGTNFSYALLGWIGHNIRPFDWLGEKNNYHVNFSKKTWDLSIPFRCEIFNCILELRKKGSKLLYTLKGIRWNQKVKILWRRMSLFCKISLVNLLSCTNWHPLSSRAKLMIAKSNI